MTDSIDKTDSDDAIEPWPTGEFERIVSQHGRQLLLYATRLLGDPSGANDAVQETYLRLCRQNPDTVRPKLAAWLFTVCRNKVIDMQRYRARTHAIDPDPIANTLADPAASPPDFLSGNEDRQQLHASIETLTDRQREVLLLRLQSELSYREIADVTGMTVSNVGFHMHAAVTSLRRQMGGLA